MYENFRSLQHAYGPFDTRLTAPSNRRPTSTLPMSHPRSTVKTYSKRRGPYDRSQVPRNSDGPSYENGSRSHHLQEFRMGSSRDRSLSNTTAEQRPDVASSSLQLTVLKGGPWVEFFSIEKNQHQLYNPVTGETVSKPQPMVEYQPQDGDSVLEGARALAEISGPGTGTVTSSKLEETDAPDPSSAIEWRPSSLLGLEGDFTTGHRPLSSPSSLSDLGLEGNFPIDHPPLPSPSSLPDHRRLPAPHESTNPAYHSTQNFQASGTPPTARAGLSLIDNKDRPVTVRDMEQFASAIQDTIREIGRQFIVVLSEVHHHESATADELGE